MRTATLVRSALAILTVLAAIAALASSVPASAELRAPQEMGSSDWRRLSAGDDHTCGLRTSGRLYCWGLDDFGQLGNDGGGGQTTPGEVLPSVSTWSAVSSGGDHTCGLRTTGRLYCWGRDTWGQLGDGGTATDSQVPVQVAGNRTDWRSVDAGFSHTCATRRDGRLFCWGYDGQGMLGDDGALADQQAPVQVEGGFTDWTTVSAGGQSTCGIRAPGRLFCWGDDDQGQLGNDVALADKPAPVPVGGRRDWRSVSVGGYHACAIRTGNLPFCWGDDAEGQLGDGAPLADRARPVALVSIGDGAWVSLTAGGVDSCGRKTTGRLYCWGDDGVGQVGDEVTLADRAEPTEVSGGATDWTAVSVGGFHVCARITSGRLFCWGANVSGQIGTQVTGAFHNLPVPVSA